MAFLEGFESHLGKVIAALGFALLLDRVRRWRAARKAAREGAGAEAFLLDSLIHKELRELAKSSGLPANLSHDGFRDWVLGVGQEKRFASSLLAKARGTEDAQTVSELANLYATVTGEAPQAAEGAINYVLTHLLKVTNSTESGRQAFRSALQLRMAGHPSHRSLSLAKLACLHFGDLHGAGRWRPGVRILQTRRRGTCALHSVFIQRRALEVAPY